MGWIVWLSFFHQLFCILSWSSFVLHVKKFLLLPLYVGVRPDSDLAGLGGCQFFSLASHLYILHNSLLNNVLETNLKNVTWCGVRGASPRSLKVYLRTWKCEMLRQNENKKAKTASAWQCAMQIDDLYTLNTPTGLPQGVSSCHWLLLTSSPSWFGWRLFLLCITTTKQSWLYKTAN